MQRDFVRRAGKASLTLLQQRASHGQRVIFFHLPKCGGTSVVEALRRSFTFYGLSATSLDPRASERAADAVGDDLLDFRERWLLYQVERGRSHLIFGHFPYTSSLSDADPKWLLLTLLREPRTQLISEFFFNRDKPAVGRFAIDKDTSLKTFLTSEAASAVGRRYVQYFTESRLRHSPAEPEALGAALSTLRTLDAVGTLEHLDAWTNRISEITGRTLHVGRVNAGPTSSTQRHLEIDDEALGLAEEACRPNRAMYEEALRLGGLAGGMSQPLVASGKSGGVAPA